MQEADPKSSGFHQPSVPIPTKTILGSTAIERSDPGQHAQFIWSEQHTVLLRTKRTSKARS